MNKIGTCTHCRGAIRSTDRWTPVEKGIAHTECAQLSGKAPANPDESGAYHVVREVVRAA